MKRAVILHPDGHVGPVFINEKLDLYQQIGQLIDGYVTIWPAPHVPNMTFFCDEDGLLRKLPVNTLATSILDEGLGSAPAVGIFVVMGETNQKGETAGLTTRQADIFLSPEGEDILNALNGYGNEEMGLDYMEDRFGGELP